MPDGEMMELTRKSVNKFVYYNVTEHIGKSLRMKLRKNSSIG